MNDNKTLIAARAYTARGLAVFPLAGKVPTTEHGVKDASTDDNAIAEWFPHARNIAIAIPPGVLVVDVDPRNGGNETWQAWLTEHGADWLTSAPHARTGGGGHHFWFRHDGTRLKKNPGEGVDLLTEGRYVVAPPSQTVERYVWERALPSNVPEGLPTPPAWLIRMATPEVREGSQPLKPPTLGDELNEAAHRYTTWSQLLFGHAWSYVGGALGPDDDGAKYRHPGSDNMVSATLKHDCLFVYSTRTVFPVTEPGDPHGVTLFGAVALLEHGGDVKACAAALRADGFLAPPPERWELVEPDWEQRVLAAPGAVGRVADIEQELRDALEAEPEGELRLGAPIDWPALWVKDDDVEQRWLSEPIVARGRSHALFAGAKVGKSLLMLEMCAALASGRAWLDKPAHDPIAVMYCDYEMTDDDVRERLEGFGYGPADLGLLHYFLLSSGHGLDTLDGGDALVHDAVKLGVELVVIDTTARAITGAENDADTLRALYRYTGARLKRRGIATVRLDHAGKDATKGQRGTSAKNDDVDLVWRLTARDGKGEFNLDATHQRMGWVPRTVELKLTESNEGALAWERRAQKEWHAGTGECATALDRAGAPLDLSVRKMKAWLRERNLKGWRDEVLTDALKWRRESGNTPGNTPQI